MAKAKKTTINGIVFDSKTEAEYYMTLLACEKNGEISNLSVQPEFILFEPFKLRKRTVRGMKYTPDFSYEQDGVIHIVEVKGYARDGYLMRRKIFLWMYGDSHVFHEVKRKGKKFIERVW